MGKGGPKSRPKHDAEHEAVADVWPAAHAESPGGRPETLSGKEYRQALAGLQVELVI